MSVPSIVKTLQEYSDSEIDAVLRKLFINYADASSASTLSSPRFSKLWRDAGVVGNGQLTTVDIDLVFVRTAQAQLASQKRLMVDASAKMTADAEWFSARLSEAQAEGGRRADDEVEMADETPPDEEPRRRRWWDGVVVPVRKVFRRDGSRRKESAE